MASMFKKLTKLSIAALVLLTGATGVHADSGDRDGRGARQRDDFRSSRPDPAEFRRFNESQAMDSSGGEGGKRQGRMSPEERRALRKQINDANQDMYSPRR
jgi:hypothetical protein